MPFNYYHAATSRSHLVLPLILLLSSIAGYLQSSTRHGLLTSAIAWTSICALATLRLGVRGVLDATGPQKLAWASGALLALGKIEERSTGDGGRCIWWAKALLPLVVCAITQTSVFSAANGHATTYDLDSPTGSEDKGAPRGTPSFYGITTPLLISSAAGVVAVYTASGSSTVVSLGLSDAALTALAFVLIEKAKTEALYQSPNGSVIYSANGLLAQPDKPAASAEETTLSVIRGVAASAAVGTGVASLTLERFGFGELAAQGVWGDEDQWVWAQAMLMSMLGLALIALTTVIQGSMLAMIQRYDALTTSLVPPYAAVCSQLIANLEFGRIWFAAICVVSTLVWLDDAGALSIFGAGSALGTRLRMRARKALSLVAVVSFAISAFWHLGAQWTAAPRLLGGAAPVPWDGSGAAPPAEVLAPLELADAGVHPVDQLVRSAESSWAATLQRQSQSLGEAVEEYKRRYKAPPPPHFDKWYEFAKRKNVQLIDEYDTIYQALLPFWALPPATVRARAREALGFAENNLMGVLVRDGKTVHVEGGQEWLQEAVQGMMQPFVQYLPDMDLAFNIHDEPRVVVPHDELNRLVQIAVTERMPAALSNPSLRNAFSSRPADVRNSKRIPEVKTTRFNVFAHQPTWLPSRLSCPADAPARCLDEQHCSDNLTAYSLSALGFIYNHTASSDICYTPSLATSHGFFDRPNAFNVIHELFPIFSQSKMSSFQDILYPSPWYWFGKVAYDEEKDLDWQAKINHLWWRGSTTGGFSRDGGWRRQHRQKLVTKLNGPGPAQILENTNKDDQGAAPEWHLKSVQRQDYSAAIDVRFSHIGQCDPGDCDAQREFFDVAPPADQQDAWKYRFLLDVDGNAFSGRFYAFLKSKSLTFKMAVFREWHEEWIKPWVHYIPLSLRGNDALESVRYLGIEAEGKAQAVKMADESREWARKVLRNEDFEAWFFRLLLEYGRIVDNNRENIGYTGA